MVEKIRKSVIAGILACQVLLSWNFPACSQSGRNGVWSANGNQSNTAGSSAQPYAGTRDPRSAQYQRNLRYPATAPSGMRSAGNYPAQVQAQRSAPQAASAASRGQLLDYQETVAGHKYLVHLPHTYSQASPAPVVIVFHGLGMNGTSVRGLSAMDLTAERYGFITIYPDAIGRRWNDGVQHETGVDDVAFVASMLDAVAAKFKIDSRRVYACGISNGGFFVQRLACELPNRIAAIGVVAATASDAICAHCSVSRGMPVVFFLGTDDPLFPREGETKELGKLGDALGLSDLGIKNLSSSMTKFAGIMSATEAPEFWARNNRASANPRQEVLPDRDPRDGCKVRRETYGGGSEVVVYTIEGGGHSWPGGMGFVAQDIIGRTTNDINASEIMWQFFQSHSR